MPVRRWRSASAALLLLLVSACGGAAPPQPTPTALPSPVAVPQPTIIQQPNARSDARSVADSAANRHADGAPIPYGHRGAECNSDRRAGRYGQADCGDD